MFKLYHAITNFGRRLEFMQSFRAHLCTAHSTEFTTKHIIDL